MDENKKFKLHKAKCDLCGKTFKLLVRDEAELDDAICGRFYKFNKEEGDKIQQYLVCFDCESKYHVISSYGNRGYGYNCSCRPKFTRADRPATPTYGVELEVAGNIKNISKIKNLGEQEVSIGYDTSVEGAQFELSYAPGTYYWYFYESKLRPICKLLQKDDWVKKDSTTAGMHIHVGNINKRKLLHGLIYESIQNSLFWTIIRIFGERQLNQYCRPMFLNGHHDAISLSGKWNTVEFRIFKMTFDFDKIMSRMRFIRQIINHTKEDGVHWNEFSEESKRYFFSLLKSYTGIKKEVKETIETMFKVSKEESGIEFEKVLEATVEDIRARIDRCLEHDYYNENEEEEYEDEEEGW